MEHEQQKQLLLLSILLNLSLSAPCRYMWETQI